MPHPLEEYRDRIDALIGPVEQIVADLSELCLDNAIDGATHTYTLGGLEQALETLTDCVNAIDEYEEPAPEPEEPDEPDEEETDEEEEEEEE